MKETKTSVFSNGLIWFGAAVSIAEILTGTLIAPLGFARGIAAILIGHLIGCALLYMAGLIGALSERSAMETVKLSFGQKGAVLFSSLNVLQLAGWTAVMIASGSKAAEAVVRLGGGWVWCAVIGALIVVWIVIGLKNMSRVNIVAMGGLLLLTVLLSTVIFKGAAGAFFADTLPFGASAAGGSAAASAGGVSAAGGSVSGGSAAAGGLSFGAAVELSVAMPLSWLPLISDYTRNAEKPKTATAVSVLVYFIASCWMYVIGMGAALFTGKSDIAEIMLSAGLGAAALIIIVFSTVTTTFLDAYSAGVSCGSISKRFREKPAAVLVCAAGTLLAVFTPIDQFEGFLYLIGSVFAPMIAILIADFFILKRDRSACAADPANLAVWAAGFLLYRVFMRFETPVGNTLPVMLITAAVCIFVNQPLGGKNHAEKNR